MQTTNGGGRERPTMAYLLLTHHEPRRVEPLIERILDRSPAGVVVVHHDAAAGALPRGGRSEARVRFVDRGPVRWGHWSMVEATLRLLRAAVDDVGADWMVLLSAEHRPLVDLGRWEDSLASSEVDAFCPGDPLPRRLRFGPDDPGGTKRLLARYRLRWHWVGRPRSELGHRVVGNLAKLTRRTHPLVHLEYAHRADSWVLGLPRRQGAMRGWTFHKGSQWVALNRRAARAVLDVDPAVTTWFRHTYIPDESYIHSIVHRRDDLRVDDGILTWVPDDPTGRPGGLMWMRLLPDDLPAVRASGAAFARKVDPVGDPGLMATIDAVADGRLQPAQRGGA